jgi:hypothetical protein
VYYSMMSPDPFIQKCGSLQKAKSVFLEVVDRSIRLAWMNDDEADFMKRADLIGLGITWDMLLEAISKAGGSTSMYGNIP